MTLGLYYNVTDLEERWDSTWPGSLLVQSYWGCLPEADCRPWTPGYGGAGGEEGDCLLRAQRLVPVQVMLLKQRSEELQNSGVSSTLEPGAGDTELTIWSHAYLERKSKEKKVLRWDFNELDVHYTHSDQNNWIWNQNQRDFREIAILNFY